jgi:hypothetical protein
VVLLKGFSLTKIVSEIKIQDVGEDLCSLGWRNQSCLSDRDRKKHYFIDKLPVNSNYSKLCLS